MTRSSASPPSPKGLVPASRSAPRDSASLFYRGTIVTLTDIDLRAVVKIAFNHLAFPAGTAFAIEPHFKPCRRMKPVEALPQRKA